ncbi:MAG: hypothetical protein Fur0041_05650 [Bacteroidia bacterium]
MKKLLALFLSIPFLAAAGENEVKVEAPIQSVIVYLTGAEITHKKQIMLSPGRNELVFTGLSSRLIPKSIQFSASGDVSVLAISNRIDYLSGQKKNDVQVKQLSDSLIMMQDNVALVRGQIEALEKEKSMLDANQRIGGTEKGVSAAELKLSADFYVARLKEINAELVKLRRKESTQQQIVNRLNLQLSQANKRTNPPMGEIIVLVNVSGTAKITSNTELRYVVSDCGWAPSYDLIAEDIGKPIELKYRAKVFNNTDVDWNNIKMKLSTSDPMRSAAAPELEKWTLNFESGQPVKGKYYSGDKGAANAPVALQNQNLYNQQAPAMVQEGQPMQAAPPKPTNVQYDQIQVSELSAEFDIKQNYDIPSDGKPYIVDVTAYNLNAAFQYRAVPNTEKDAFLMARITGWEDLDLVEGPANVYFGGTYVGQSVIKTRSVDDTLDISLGRDQKIVVTRTKLKEFNSEKSSGSQKKETYSYEIIIKNTRKSPIDVELLDQIPVSQEAEIIVDKIELSKGDLDPATGFVRWKFNIPPGESVKVVLTYSVRYPKTKSVRTKKYRTVAAPSF